MSIINHILSSIDKSAVFKSSTNVSIKNYIFSVESYVLMALLKYKKISIRALCHDRTINCATHQKPSAQKVLKQSTRHRAALAALVAAEVFGGPI